MARAEALATGYGAPDGHRRRRLLDEMADIVASCAALERHAVTLL